MSGRVEDPVDLADDDDTNQPPEDVADNDPPVEEDEDPEEYVVEAIRAKRKNPKTGNIEYLVKWADYPETDNTWEPAEHLKCPDVVDKFNEEEASKKAERKRKKTNGVEGSTSKSQSAAKRPRRADGAKNRVFVERDSDTEDEDDDSVDGTLSLRQKQATRDPTPEPVVKGFDRGLEIEKIITASIGDNDKIYFFVKWQGLSEFELLEVDELEKKAPRELCRWYREKFYCDIKYNKVS